MLAKPGIALIGAGKFGRNYIKAALACDAFNLEAVASNNPDTASLVPSGVKVIKDWRDVIKLPPIDGVVIATPPGTHAEIAIAALDAGKAVLCEKPMTLSMDQAAAIKAAIAGQSSSPVVFLVNHIYLYHPAFRVMLENIALIGNLRRITSCGGNYGPFRTDVTALWDYGPHDIAMAIAAAKSDTVSIKCSETDNYQVQIAFHNGVKADLQFGNAYSDKRRWMELEGDNGVLRFDDLADVKLTYNKLTELKYNKILPLETIVTEFGAAITSGQTEVRDFYIGQQVVEALEKCEKMI